MVRLAYFVHMVLVVGALRPASLAQVVIWTRGTLVANAGDRTTASVTEDPRVSGHRMEAPTTYDQSS